MTKKIHERVLNENNSFEAFPDRQLKKAVAYETRQPVDPEPIDPLIQHGQKSKAELAAKSKKKKE